MPLSLICPNLVRWTFANQTLFVGDMTSRDAWDSVKGTSKEDAQKKYVAKLLEVRTVLHIITGTCGGCTSEHTSPFITHFPSPSFCASCTRGARAAPPGDALWDRCRAPLP